jgi:hypothetical protein
MLAHHKPNQFKWLISSISAKLNGKASFLIHIDKKSDINEFYFEADECISHVDFIDNRFDVEWGELSIVEATIALLEQANKSYQFRHVILISGEDAVVSLDALHSLNSDTSWMNYWVLPYTSWWGGGMFRVDRPHFFDKKNRRYLNFKLHQYFGGLLNRFSPKSRMAKQFPDMLFYGGQQWMVLSWDAVDYLIGFVRKNPRIWDVFRHSFASDELFIQTILCNNKYLKILNKPTHYVRFNGFDSSPDYLKDSEINELKNSGAFLFARKYAG